MTTRTPDAEAPDDEGSVLLLTLGYALLAIALVLVCVDSTSLYLTQKRADAAADAAALAGADGFTLTVDGAPRAVAQGTTYGDVLPGGTQVVAARVGDDVFDLFRPASDGDVVEPG